MKVTLQVNGREMTFSEQELSSILEEHFSSNTTKKATTAKVVQKPTEDAWFEVKPQAINQNLFGKKRNDICQENIRQLILEAFVEMKASPGKYGKNFKTMMPKREWRGKTVAELKEMACKLGDHNADWVEQALEWAQRIANGESWEVICNAKDTANWQRIVVWKNGYPHVVGGSVNIPLDNSASHIIGYNYQDYHCLFNTVPLVVLYE